MRSVSMWSNRTGTSCSGSIDELVAWLKANKPEAFKDPKASVGGKLKRGRLFDWE